MSNYKQKIIQKIIKMINSYPNFCDYMYKKDGKWYTNTNWTCDHFKDIVFEGKTKEEAVEKMIDYYNDNIMSAIHSKTSKNKKEICKLSQNDPVIHKIFQLGYQEKMTYIEMLEMMVIELSKNYKIIKDQVIKDAEFFNML